MKVLFKKLLDYRLLRFILVGIINTAFGTGIMFALYNIFHFNYWISSASNYVVGSILSYILNRFFTFQSNSATQTTLPRFIINIIFCYVLAYGIAKPFSLRILEDLSQQAQDNTAMLIGMLLFVGLNYIGQRFFVFRDK